jgi:fumarylpyruvate hydrolase
MEYVVPFAGVTTVPVTGSTSVFPVRRIYLVGRNYAAHAREMGHDPDREPPFFFQKPADALLLPGNDFPYPPKSSDVHHEIEMVVALGKGGKDIAEADALSHVYGYAVGIDMTRRDLQGEAKKMGRPWEVGKAFECSAPISPIVPATAIGHPDSGRVWLEINGELRQEGDLNQLIWNVPETIAYLSSLFTLAPGDLIYSGTPAGVGPVQRGDKLRGGVDGIGTLETQVV